MTTTEDFREQIVSLTGYAPESRTVQAFMEVVTAAAARGRADLAADIEALCMRSDQIALRVAEEMDIAPFDGAPLTRQIRAVLVRESA